MDNELKVQIQEVLIDGLDYMKLISKNFNILTDAITSGNKVNVARNFEDLREGLQWIGDALDNFGNLLELDYSTIMVGKQNSKKIIDDYMNFITEWESSFNNGDFEKLSGLTEDKLQKHLKKLMSVFNKVKVIMKEKEN